MKHVNPWTLIPLLVPVTGCTDSEPMLQSSLRMYDSPSTGWEPGSTGGSTSGSTGGSTGGLEPGTGSTDWDPPWDPTEGTDLGSSTGWEPIDEPEECIDQTMFFAELESYSRTHAEVVVGNDYCTYEEYSYQDTGLDEGEFELDLGYLVIDKNDLPVICAGAVVDDDCGCVFDPYVVSCAEPDTAFVQAPGVGNAGIGNADVGNADVGGNADDDDDDGNDAHKFTGPPANAAAQTDFKGFIESTYKKINGHRVAVNQVIARSLVDNFSHCGTGVLDPSYFKYFRRFNLNTTASALSNTLEHSKKQTKITVEASAEVELKIASGWGRIKGSVDGSTAKTIESTSHNTINTGVEAFRRAGKDPALRGWWVKSATQWKKQGESSDKLELELELAAEVAGGGSYDAKVIKVDASLVTEHSDIQHDEHENTLTWSKTPCAESMWVRGQSDDPPGGDADDYFGDADQVEIDFWHVVPATYDGTVDSLERTPFDKILEEATWVGELAIQNVANKMFHSEDFFHALHHDGVDLVVHDQGAWLDDLYAVCRPTYAKRHPGPTLAIWHWQRNYAWQMPLEITDLITVGTTMDWFYDTYCQPNSGVDVPGWAGTSVKHAMEQRMVEMCDAKIESEPDPNQLPSGFADWDQETGITTQWGTTSATVSKTIPQEDVCSLEMVDAAADYVQSYNDIDYGGGLDTWFPHTVRCHMHEPGHGTSYDFEPGSEYNVDDSHGYLGNDQITSCDIPKGCQARFCKNYDSDPAGLGDCVTHTGDMGSIYENWADDPAWNDQISRVEVTHVGPGETCPTVVSP